MGILLVEDSARLQPSIASGLRKAGYNIDVSGDSNEAARSQ